MKTVRPTWLRDGDAVHYLWPLPQPLSDEVRGHCSLLSEAACSIVALGWGINLAIGHAAVMSEEQARVLAGERWLPSGASTGHGLRAPVDGTLEALNRRYKRFLERLGPEGFAAPPPLSAYASVEYRRAVDPPFRPVAAFSMLRLDASGLRSFDPARRALSVAGMMRHATRDAAVHAGWPEAKINAFVLGHAEPSSEYAHLAVGPRRFAYLPMPSIESRGGERERVGGIRRSMLTCFGDGCGAEVAWARRALTGQELVDTQKEQPTAVLSLIAATEKIVRRYTERAALWSSVTPVVLPGYDDPAHYGRRLRRGVGAAEQKRLLAHLDDRIDGLLRKAIVQAGFSQVLAEHAELQWGKVGFLPGVDLAQRYGVPDHLKRFPRLHVRLRWRDPTKNGVAVQGPICIGGGRFYGLGLFAAVGEC